MQASPSARPTPPPVATRVEKVRQHGFTAIELMVVVAIVAVLAALAAPSFTPLIERWRVRQAAENLTSSLYFARSEAIKRGGGIALDATGGW
ncbi:MAG: pilus assembly FimT family protein, partial [Giesbergeria sp.]